MVFTVYRLRVYDHVFSKDFNKRIYISMSDKSKRCNRSNDVLEALRRIADAATPRT